MKEFVLKQIRFLTILILFVAGKSIAIGQSTYSQSSTTYSWELSSPSNVSTSSCDDCAYTLTIPFTFQFFGNNYTTVYPSTNGLLAFGTSSTAWSNVCIPNTAAPNNIIAAYWDDLYFD